MAIPQQSPPGESGTHRPLDPNAVTAVPEREPSPLQDDSQEPHGEPTLASSSSSHDLRGSSSDYGFAGSWPSIPVPLTSSGGLANRDLLVSQKLQHQESHLQGGAATASSSSSSAAAAAVLAKGGLGPGGAGGSSSGSGSCVGDVRSPSYSAQAEQQCRGSSDTATSSKHHNLDDNNKLDEDDCSGLASEGYQSAWVGASRYETIGVGFDEEVAAATAAAAAAAGVPRARTGKREGGNGNSSSDAPPAALGFAAAAAAGGGAGIGAGVGAGTAAAWAAPKEQVSLPEDIYGAARVSEYWHGMPALSSLASAYVYDDIWAGDGGLNPREDIMRIAAWAAGGGVAANQERRGGGEAVTEAGGGSSQPGGRESIAMTHSPPPQRAPRSSSEEGRVWTGQPQQQQTGAENQYPQHKRMEWRRHRPVPGSFGGGGGSGSGGRSGNRGGSGRGRRDDGTRSCDEQGSGSGMDLEEGGAREGLGSRKRRTPSPETGKESLSQEDAPAPLMWRKGAGGGIGGQGEADGPDSALIRWCKKVANPPLSTGGTASGASSGEEEKFFAGRVLEPVPRRRPVGGSFGSDGWVIEPDWPVSREAGRSGRWDNDSGGGGGGGSGSGGGGDGGGDDARCSAARRRVEGMTLPAARNPGGARFTAEMAAADAIATGGGASTSPSTSDGTDANSHRGGEESFFASHALEPSPRPGWCREAFAEGAAKESIARVANGIVVHALAQGIGTPSAGRPSGTPVLPGEVRGSSECGVTPSPPPPTVGGSVAGARIGQAVRSASASAVRTWSAKAKEEGGREGAPAVAPVAAADTDSGDWEVQPEAMAAFFTTVVGVDPPVTTMARRRGASAAAASAVPRPRPRPHPHPHPSPPLTASSLRSSQPPLRRVRRLPSGTPEPLAASSSGGVLAPADVATTATAAVAATTAAAATASAAAVATTAVTTTAAAAAGGTADPRPDSSESCSMSMWTDSGIGGGEGNSWGW